MFKENSISKRNGGIGKVIMDRQASTRIGVPILNIEIFLKGGFKALAKDKGAIDCLSAVAILEQYFSENE